LNYVKKQGSDYVILDCWMEEPYDYDAEALQGEPPRHQRAVTVYEQRVVSGSAGEQRSFLLPAGNSASAQLTYAEQKEAKGVLKQQSHLVFASRCLMRDLLTVSSQSSSS